MIRRRCLYVLLFAPLAVLVALTAAAGATGAAAGALWLLVFGDDPWPAWSSTLLVAVAMVAGSLVTATLLWLAYTAGKNQEGRPTLNRTHVVLAIGLTCVVGLLIAARLGGASAGPQTAKERCADFCRAEGVAGSGMPSRLSGDRTCRCYDATGSEVRQVPIP